jgi:hemolysin D
VQRHGEGGPQGAPSSRALVPLAPRRLTAVDREFLPATLEIMETPASPTTVALLWLICASFAAALVWSYFGWIDIHAVAQGKIQPSGRSKIVQPVEPGKVTAILVENGSLVRVGEVLVELDPTAPLADQDAQARELQSYEAEILRRRAAISAARAADSQAAIDFAADTDSAVRQRETSVLQAALAHLSSTQDSVRAQIEERVQQQMRFQSTIAARQRLIQVLKERVGMRDSLRAREFSSRAAVIDALQEVEREETTLAGDKGQMLEAGAAVRSLECKMNEVTNAFIAEEMQRLAEAERRKDHVVQELIKARNKSEHTRIAAPIGGFVQQLGVTTIGQVVAGGQALLTIVPVGGPIEIEAMILNRDIGFVEVGQSATVKVEAFPFTRYGALEATVVKISHDAVDASAAEGQKDAAAKSPESAASSSRAQSLVFPVTLGLKHSFVTLNGKRAPLSPGMAVTVEIRTGSRRVIDYVMSPLREVTAGAAHER